MKQDAWIDAGTACAILGVRAQTLYAYVSRKLVRSCSDRQDARRSLYLRADVDLLAQRNRRPRARQEVAAEAIRWGEPVLSTAISGIRDGTLWFGARTAIDCARSMTLEEVAAHHWRSPVGPGVAGEPVSGGATLAVQRAVGWLAAQMDGDIPVLGASRQQIAARGWAMLSALADVILGRCEPGPIHLRAARVWGLDARDAEVVRTALVLLSDHELNPSAFAVRVCASTGAGLIAAILAGMATLSGPLHGGVAGKASEALRAGLGGSAGIEPFLAVQGALSPYGYGFGHPLYPGGDPRAACLLATLPPDAPAVRAVWALSRRLDIPPNIDAALAACQQVMGLPEDAAFSIFAIGRLTGWVAHVIEQAETGTVIRPRARFAPA